MAGKGFFVVAVLGLVGLVRVAEQMAAVPTPAPPVAAADAPRQTEKAPRIGNGYADVTLERAADGHFYADAQVNGTEVRFLVDTGASSLVLTQADAQRAGIGAGDFNERAIGAGGEVKLMPVLLDRVAIGPIVANHVAAHVAEDGSLPVSLMGQSYLSRIGSVTIRDDAMVLR